MKVVLVLAPVWDSITPPLSLAFLKAGLAQAEYDCKCIDLSVEFRPIMVSALGDEAAEDYIAHHPDLYKGWAKRICDEKPDIVGFSLLVSNLRNTALIAREVRQLLPEATIVCGGPSLTRENGDTIEYAHGFADIIVEGEGESIFAEIVKCIDKKEDIARLKQLWLKSPDGSVYYTGAGIEQNIDNIPLPDFRDFDRNAYKVPSRLPILFSRGCILNCNYCENKWNHLTQRSRTGRLVFDELKRDVKEYGITEYMFNDDSLISYKTFRQMEEYCDLTIAEGLTLPWSVYGTRVERKLTAEYVNKLRRSGLERVSLGVESFSSRVQHEMGKSSKYDDADKTCRLFAEQGVRTEAWIIYGYPTESDADFNETLQWFIKNPGVLSHVTANTFGPNAKYLHDKPGMVQYHSYKSWNWSGQESTLEKRKQRFLLLIEVLENIRRTRKGDFSFYFGDPLYVKYFSAWGKKEKSYLMERWDELQNIPKKTSGLQKALHLLGLRKKATAKIAGEHNYGLPQHEPGESQNGYEEPLNGYIIHGSADELRKLLSDKIKNQLGSNQYNGAEQQKGVDEYMKKLLQVHDLVGHEISERVIYMMSLNGSVRKVIEDLDAYTPEELAQRAIHHYSLQKAK